MKLKEGFKLRELMGDTILVPESTRLVDFNRMIVLNPTAAYLWKELKDKDFELQDIVKLLLDKYEVTEEKALEDSKTLIEKWAEAGLTQ